jgi:predicted O-linked N-acetylglucosamine transferase (SPINDLY family)
MALHKQGRLAEAEMLYRQMLALGPPQFAPHYYLGVLCMSQGRFAEAVDFLKTALRLRDGDIGTLVNLGMALRHLGQPDDALAPLGRAIAARPDLTEAHYQRAAALHELGRLEEAREDAARAVALSPEHLNALFLHALVLGDMGRGPEARAAYDRLLQRNPDHIDARNNRGLLAWGAGDAEAALADLNRAVALNPKYTPSLTNRALVLGGTGRAAEALADYDRLLALTPGDAEIWNRHGATLRSLDRDAQALESFDAALRLKPDFVTALSNRGYLRWVVENRYEDAKADLTRALALDPAQPWLEGELFYLKMQGADWDGFAEGRAALAAGIAAGRQVVKPFAYQAICGDPASLQQCARIFAADFPAFPPPPSLARGPATAPPPLGAARAGEVVRRRIRVGYVSADFREQATAYLMAGVYEAHDRGDFEIIAFDNGFDDASPMRARLERAFDRFVPITGLSDTEAAAAARAAGIDILVNLNGYFGKPRTNVFAQRAAPLQVNYLGFPSTLGAAYMDYIIADRVVIPAPERRFYDEAVVWLPDSYQANDDKRALPGPTSRAEHGLPQDAFVFCNFNQSYKLAPEIFALWLRLLRDKPDSVLWLLHDRDAANANLRREAERQGVAAARLIFAPMIPLEQHLARVALADLFLDTLPYNAHTTGSDALWAGVPMVTCRGTAFPGRVAASLLQAANLPELITETAADYEALAAALAADRTRLAELRAKLTRNRTTCPLFDTARFTRHLETAYRIMVARQRAGQAPEAFSVPA